MERGDHQRLTIIFFILIIIMTVINVISGSKIDANADKEKTIAKTIEDIDRMAPGVTINFPVNNYKTNSESLLIEGSAFDNNYINTVKIKVNNDKWEDVSGTTKWSKMIYLIHGTNVVYVQAFDYSGNASPVDSRVIIYE